MYEYRRVEKEKEKEKGQGKGKGFRYVYTLYDSVMEKSMLYFYLLYIVPYCITVRVSEENIPLLCYPTYPYFTLFNSISPIIFSLFFHKYPYSVSALSP